MLSDFPLRTNSLFCKNSSNCFYLRMFFLLFFINITLQGQQNADLLEKKLASAKNTERVDLLNELSFLNNRLSYKKSIEYSSQALDLAKKIKYRKGESDAFRNIGLCNYLHNNLQQAEINFKNSLQIALSFKDSSGIAKTLNYIGLLYWRQNEFTNAFKYYSRSLGYSNPIGLEIEISKSLNYMGLIYWKWSEYALALDFFIKSLKIKEKLKDQFEIVVSLNNIANIYNELSNYKLALEYALRALSIAQKINDKYGTGRALNIIGVTYFKLNDFKKAEESQFKSIEVKESVGDISGLGFSYNDLGNIYRGTKQYSKALEFYNKSLSYRRKLNDHYGIANLMNAIGKVYLEIGNYEKSKNYLSESMRLASNENLKDVVKNNYLSFSSLYERQGNNIKALSYYKLYSAIKDSIFNVDNIKRIAQLQVRNEFEEKEREIELLKKERRIQSLEVGRQKTQITILIIVLVVVALIILSVFLRIRYVHRTNKILEEKNKEIQLRENELLEANSTKDKFISIIAHDLRSPFTGLLGMSQILIDGFEYLPKEKVRSFLKEFRASIVYLLDLIENLLNWARLQSGRMEFTPEKLNLNEEAQKIINLLTMNASVKHITLSNKVDKDFYVLADMNMIDSVIQNLTANAIKFTKPEGNIKISAECKDGFIEVTISDNGIGIPPEALENIFSSSITRQGTDKEKGSGLGLALCKDFVKKNGGKIWIKSELNKGTTIFFSLKKID